MKSSVETIENSRELKLSEDMRSEKNRSEDKGKLNRRCCQRRKGVKRIKF